MNKTKLNLNKEFYPINSIKKTIKEFKEVCEIQLKENLTTVDLIFITENETVKKEFMNYCLYKAKQELFE